MGFEWSRLKPDHDPSFFPQISDRQPCFQGAMETLWDKKLGQADPEKEIGVARWYIPVTHF